jgi:DNA-binding NtrC family response regulator
MPVVFVIAEDWTLRSGVRAELREHGIEALGMESASDAGRALAAGPSPAAVVLDSGAKAAADPAIQQLASRVPTIVIASSMQSAPALPAAKIFHRPVRIAEIVSAVLDLLKGQTA